MAGWTTRTLARQTGTPIATVASWVAAGLVNADHYGRGRGGNVIGVSGLLELLAVLELRAAGFSLQSIRRAVENLRSISGCARPLAHLIIVVEGKDILWRDSRDLAEMTFSALHTPGQRLMVFPIGEKHAQLLHQLQEKQPTRYKSTASSSTRSTTHVTP